MSYGATCDLQGAVWQALRNDATLSALVGDAIFDAMPVDPPSGPYLALGVEDVTDAGDVTARGARHDFVVSVIEGARRVASPRSRLLLLRRWRRWTELRRRCRARGWWASGSSGRGRAGRNRAARGGSI